MGQCTNQYGDEFVCAPGDRCCGNSCVRMGDVCCENVLGDNFPCEGNGGGCCGNACFAPGSKCCKSPFVAKARWYPVTQDTKCAFGWPWRAEYERAGALPISQSDLQMSAA